MTDLPVFLDEVEAWDAADSHFERVIDSLTSQQRAFARTSYEYFKRSEGGVRILWVDNKIRMMATVIRNDLNRSVLILNDVKPA